MLTICMLILFYFFSIFFSCQYLRRQFAAQYYISFYMSSLYIYILIICDIYDSRQAINAPLWPCLILQTTSSLNGRAYAAEGQAGGSLHTMVLQAYQVDLLKELNQGQGLSPEDLNLWATKQTFKLVVQWQRWWPRRGLPCLITQ